MVDLPIQMDEILKNLDAVIITHTHVDHWDDCASKVIPKDIPIFVQNASDKKVVVYSAGTFGQQLVKRFSEQEHCEVIGWIDEDYWEYRRCCMNVDPIESVSSLNYDFVLIATVIPDIAKKMTERLIDCGVSTKKILTVHHHSENSNELIKKYSNTKEENLT